MKKIQKIAAVSVLTFTLLAPGFAAAETSKDMAMIDYSKVRVIQMNGMELVPVREMAKSLGYSVKWNQREKSVTLTYSMMMKDKMTEDGMMEDGMMKDKMMEDDMMEDGMMEDKMMEDDMMEDGMMKDKMMEDDMMEDGMMKDKMMEDDMVEDGMMKDKMMDKDMHDMGYTVKITMGQTTFMAGMSEKMLAYEPVMVNNKLYITKDFVEMYLASPSMMK
ncbi:stalk domain-containing protein [Paenibacillus tarimensis]